MAVLGETIVHSLETGVAEVKEELDVAHAEIVRALMAMVAHMTAHALEA